MNLRHLEIFVTVCETKSFTKAAEKMNIAQPAVSLAIKEIEKYYQTPLFDRISHHLYLTEAGKNALDYARRILALIQEADDVIKNEEKEGEIRMGASITIGTCLLPALAKSFAVTHPKAKLQVRIDDSSSLEKMVLQNQLDFALVEGATSSPNLVIKKFLKDDLAFVGKTGGLLKGRKEIRAEEVATLPLLLRERGSGTRELFESALLMKGVSISPLWESVSTKALIQAVLQNLGVTALPRRLLAEELKKGTLTEYLIKGIKLERDFCFIRRKEKHLSKIAVAFLEQIPNFKKVTSLSVSFEPTREGQ